MKQSKIRNSYNTRDIYRKLKKEGGFKSPLSESDFGLIVKSLNTLLADELKENAVVELPMRMGKIVVVGYDRKIIKNKQGKYIPNTTPNWKETMELWKNDEEARENKVLIYHEDKKQFSVKFRGEGTNFSNKRSLNFKLRRTVREDIRKLINSNKLVGFVK